jgi:hypothetical protein
MTPTQPSTLDAARMTRAQRAAALEHRGRPSIGRAARRLYPAVGDTPARHHHRPRRDHPGAVWVHQEERCRPCADKARRLRMAQCREGWHLDAEPVTDRAEPTEKHKELMAARADLITAYAESKANADEQACEQTPMPSPNSACLGYAAG